MKIRDRIKSFRRVKASELLPNPKNWRTHPQAQQDAMRGLLAEIGFAGAALARETKAGLMLLDGHLRAALAPDQKIPVLVLDVTEAEAAKLLATFDPVGKMADADPEALAALLADIDTESEALQAMLDGLAAEAELEAASEAASSTELKPLSIKQPPKMAWALIGIPTVRYGEIAGHVEAIAAIDGTIVEMTANDG